MRRLMPHLWSLAIVALLTMVTACGQYTQTNTASPQPADTPASARTADVVIPGADRFTPFVLTITQGDTVRWVNKDTDEHVIVTVPGTPESFTLPVQGGRSVSHTFHKAGIYYYYCSIHATYDARTGQVAGNPQMADNPYEPMEGVVVVQDR